MIDAVGHEQAANIRQQLIAVLGRFAKRSEQAREPLAGIADGDPPNGSCEWPP